MHFKPLFMTKLRSIGNISLAVLTLLSLVTLAGCARAQDPPTGQQHVIHISVDALGAKYLEKFLKEAPADFNNFGRLIKEGASTMNARTDFNHTVTLPNHTSMVTGRPVKTPAEWTEAKGHEWTWNAEFPSPKAPASLHATNPDKGYTASSFDVAHDAGLKTALYSGKSKFKMFAISYGPEFGAEHAKGRNKIDRFITTEEIIHARALADLKEFKPNYAFLHYPEPDMVGHAHGYLGDEYRNSLKQVNGYLGELLALIETDAEWKDHTVIILSADHGGEPGTRSHPNFLHPYNYTIPFIVWGNGIAKGADLYELNKTTRTNPGEDRPAYAATNQPIRNGDGGNLALKILGLPAIPGSSINNKQDLAVR